MQPETGENIRVFFGQLQFFFSKTPADVFVRVRLCDGVAWQSLASKLKTEKQELTRLVQNLISRGTILF